ncbi:MAG: DNA primase, partial [Clostridiales bacterium]|nr:DNA primase [Clostridiales bacterium]
MYENIPDELRRLSQWVCWQALPDESRPGKIKKIPINALTGGRAMSNNPQTWCGFDAAVKASARFSGIGIMFANGIFGVDLDDIGDELADYQNGADDNVVGEF